MEIDETKFPIVCSIFKFYLKFPKTGNGLKKIVIDGYTFRQLMHEATEMKRANPQDLVVHDMDYLYRTIKICGVEIEAADYV